MIPWVKMDSAAVPGQKEFISLFKRGEEFSIRTTETELMNSRIHGSEEALAQLTCALLKQKKEVRILIGGLGMGYTLAATLEQIKPDTQIVIAELIPQVVEWNKKYLGHLACYPIKDTRVSVKIEDVANIIREKKRFWDAIILDVDNGPAGLTKKSNNQLYNLSGLQTSFDALKPGGILSVWSSAKDDAFTRRLKKCRFKTRIETVRAHRQKKGSRHTIWLAKRP